MGYVLKWVVLTWLLLTSASGGVIRDADDGEESGCRSYVHNGLTHVDCSDLGLTVLPEGLDYQAQVVDLSNNHFREFPSGLQHFLRLEELNLSGNHLSGQLPAFIKSWTNIHTLNLSDNNYTNWGLALGTSITKLDLSKNKINTVDETAFVGMSSLYFLDLSENRISSLPWRVFTDAKSLDHLILSRNGLSAFPDILSSSLRSLDLSGCQLSGLSPNSLAGLTSLLELNLSMNQIETVPDNFGANKLQELDLSYNYISSLSDRAFSSLPHLAVLDLRGNDFREIWSSSIFASNPFLREVQLKGNRWNCEGFGVNLLLTYEFLTREPTKVHDRASLICYYPSNVTQLSWQDAYIKTWHPSVRYESYTMVAVMCGVIIGVLLTSAVCRGLVSINSSESTANGGTNLNGAVDNQLHARVDSVVLRIPLREDLPPSYDEALLMPRLNSSFHSLPDFVDEEESDARRFRRSRSIGDLMDSRPRTGERRSVRRTVEINIE